MKLLNNNTLKNIKGGLGGGVGTPPDPRRVARSIGLENEKKKPKKDNNP